MNFVFFASLNVGINLEHVEWYVYSDNKLTIRMASGKHFLIDDEDEILYFLSFSTALEFEDEAEGE